MNPNTVTNAYGLRTNDKTVTNSYPPSPKEDEMDEDEEESEDDESEDE